MLWIKRNLFLVVGGVVALGLLVLSVIYLWNSYQENSAVDGKLAESKEQLSRLSGLVPSPTKENIEKARAELQKLETATKQTQKSFTPLPYEKVKDKAFTALLANTIDDLQKRAMRASVTLPATNHYAFTFAEQQKRFQFSEGSFPILSEQLAEIQAICLVLFEAKINKLTGLRRGRVTSDDPPAAPDYHELRPERTLPSGAVVSPYVAEFTAFSTELAATLEGFYKSPNGLLVKAVEVRPLDEKEAPPQPGGAATPTPVPGNPQMRRPLPPPPGAPGTPPRPAQRPRPNGNAVPPGASAGEGFKTVLDEKLLRITLWIDVLKPPAK